MEQQGGQYVAYTFYKVDPAWRRLPFEERAAGKEAFAEVIEAWAERLERATGGGPTAPPAELPRSESLAAAIRNDANIAPFGHKR